MKAIFWLIISTLTHPIFAQSGWPVPVFLDFDPFFGQETDFTPIRNWDFKYSGQLTLTQNELSNHPDGQQNSFAALGVVNMVSNYRKKRFSFLNVNNFQYGVLRTRFQPNRKTQDIISVALRPGYLLKPRLTLTPFVTFDTQFNETFAPDNPQKIVSRFMAPGFLSTSFGVEYSFKPKRGGAVLFLFSPLSGRVVFVQDQTLADLGTAGVPPAKRNAQGEVIEPGQKNLKQLGILGRIDVNSLPVVKNVTFNGFVSLRNNYADPDINKRLNFIVEGRVFISMDVNKYVKANITSIFSYDHNVPIPVFKEDNGKLIKVSTGPRLYLNQSFGVGLSYLFKRDASPQG